MKILAHRNINLHSKFSGTGLIPVYAGKTHIVPDDVAKQPSFDALVKDGYLTVQEWPAESEIESEEETAEEAAETSEEETSEEDSEDKESEEETGE